MKRFSVALVAVAVFAITVYAADEKKKAKEVDLKDVKCVMNPKGAAKADHFVKYKKGKVYFCCENCPVKFKEDRKKFATAANYQLVATKQAKQEACPLSGGKIDASTKIDVQGAQVAFCCNNCKGAVAKLEGKAQLEKVFSAAAFKKAKFAVAVAEKK